MVLYGAKINCNESEDWEETQGPEYFARALLMIHELGKGVEGVRNIPKVGREMKVTCRKKVNWSEDSYEQAINDEEENCIVTSDQSHKSQLLLMLIWNKGVNTMDEHMIL